MAKKEKKVKFVPAETAQPVAQPAPGKASICKACGSKLYRVVWDERKGHRDFVVFVCPNEACGLFRQFQGKEGNIPEGLTIRFV